MKPTIVIHTNAKQRLGAMVAAHSYRRNSADPSRFDVRIVNAEDFPELSPRGKTFLRGGHVRTWDPDDLQSFTPLRFKVPELLEFTRTALVVDPDIFAVADVANLLTRDLQGKAIWCRPRTSSPQGPLASSVMLLDCSKLRHWRWDESLEALWDHRLDYLDWINLEAEDRSIIGLLEPEWNDFDHLSERTGLLHNTRRRTQPWKTGLPIDFTFRERRFLSFTLPLVRRMAPRYTRHPDVNQEAYFYALLADAIEQGSIDRQLVDREIDLGHVRPDSPALIEHYRGCLWPAQAWVRKAA